MDKLRRGIHLDFHTLPGIYDFAANFDADAFASTLADAHVEIINVFARCNIGFSYYPTKIGVPYPGMKIDLLGEMIRACHARSIKVVAYVNAGINHELCRLHPEWCQINENGQIRTGDPANNNCFRTPCYNTGWGEHLLAEIREIVENYDVDGIFTDCMMLRPCWCDKCTADMKAEGIDITNRAAVTEFAHRQILDTVRKIREIIPEGKLFHPNSLKHDEVDAWQTHAEVEVLPSGSCWNYDSFLPEASYMRTLYGQVLYMTGRFQSSWGDFGGLRTKASIENDIYDALTAGVQYSVGDHMHPADGLIGDMYRMLGEIYARTKLYEEYTDEAKYLAEAAILLHRGGGMPQAVTGAVRMLAELKVGFDVINEDRDFSLYRLLIVPENIGMTDTLMTKLRAFADHGGKLIFAGGSMLNPARNGFALRELDSLLSYHGPDNSNASYYITREAITGVRMKYSTYSGGILIKAADDASVIADRVAPYFDRHWDGQHGYFYTPPAKEDGFTAAALRENLGVISFGIFSAYCRKASVFHKKLVARMLDELLPDRQILAPSLPSTSRLTLTGTDSYRLLHVKVTFPEPRGPVMDAIEEHVTLPAGREVTVRGECGEVLRLPDKTPIPFVAENGCTRITLPEITGYDMFLLR